MGEGNGKAQVSKTQGARHSTENPASPGTTDSPGFLKNPHPISWFLKKFALLHAIIK
jgi:hypothetical protein